MSARRRTAGGEEGSALLMALIFATVFSLFVAAMISFVEVGLRASRTFGDLGRAAYATDGAVNAAINRFRTGGPCDSYTAPAGPDGLPLHGRGVIVHCVDDNRPASGRATKPRNTLLSLGAEGISTYPGFEQRVLGDIFSNSTVSAGATLVVQGTVAATGDCTPPGNIRTAPPTTLRCANTGGGADPVDGRDPDYVKATATVPVHRTVPACPAGWLVALEPGYYDDAAALSSFTTTTGSCTGKVVWLKPGNYYLDFTFRGGAGTWTIDDPAVDVVAGTPKGWDPAAPARPALRLPGSCRTAADAAPVEGVQLIAGGGTHLRITAGRVELCARPSASDQSIALYGIGPRRPTHDLEPTDWTGVSGFMDPGSATVIGETPAALATATLATGPTSAATATFTAFRPPVPEGSVIDSASLRVVHRDVGDLDAGSVKVEATFAGSTCSGGQAAALPLRGTLTEDRIDLKADCGLTSAAAFAGLAVTYRVALASGGSAATDWLDGIAVEVAYRTPTTGRPTAVTTSSGFANPAHALEIGEQPVALTADAALTPAGPTTASVTVAGLGEPPIPPGSVIDSAVLRVAHRDQGDIAAPTVTVPFAGGTCTGLALPVQAAALMDDRVDLKACGLDLPSELVGLTATYDVALASGGTSADATLDGMWLELVYRPPALTRPPATATAAGFADADRAKVVGEQPTALTADAVLRSGGPTTASLTLSDYGPPAVPAGSYIDSAVLRVVHRDSGPMDTPTLAVAFAGNACPTPVLTKHAAALGEDRIDLRACGLTDPAKLAGLSVTFTANLTGGAVTPPDAVASVDGVVLDLAYRPPSTRRLATATTGAPGFSDPDRAKVIGESPTPLTADVTLANGAAPASVTLNGFNQVPLPAGSAIDSAVLRVAHHDDAWMGPVTLATSFTGSTCAVQTLARHPAAIGVDRSVDLTGCGFKDAAQLAGLTATYTAQAPTSTTATQVPTSTGAVTGFADPAAGRAIDGVTSNAALDAATPSASLTLGGYDLAPPPPGSTISAAVLRVAHHDDPGVGTVTVTVLLSGTPCLTQALAPRATPGEDAIDLAPCGITDPAQLPGLAVTYDVAGGATAATARLDGAVVDLTYQAPSGTARLDGVELDIVFRPPTFRPLDGCVTEPGYPGGGSCALLLVQPAAGDTVTRFAAQGTIYAPSGMLDISMAGLRDQVLARGLVSRGIRLGLQADPGYRRPLVGVPPEPVRFTAYSDVTGRAGTATSPPPGFANPDAAKVVGEKPTALTADAGLDTTDPTASLTLGDFTQDVLPAGSLLDAAVLRVVHREDVDVASVEVTVAGLAAGPCAPTRTFPLPLYRSAPATPGPLGEDQIDLTAACGLVDPAQLAGLTVTFTATLAGAPATAATARLDGITIDLLSRPLLRARVAFDTTRDEVLVQGWSVLR